MRIAFITPEFPSPDEPYGGLATYLAKISALLVDRGHQVDVFTKTRKHGFERKHHGACIIGVLPKWAPVPGIARIDAWIPREYQPTYHDVKGAWCLFRRWRKEHKTEPYDIVQVANVQAVGLFFDTARYPVVMRLSSYRPLWDKLAFGEVSQASKHRSNLEARSIRKQRHLYAPTRFVARQTESNILSNAQNVSVIPTPFSRWESQPDEQIAQDLGRPYFLFFGRHTMMKGVHILAETLNPILSANPEWHCVAAGDDSPAPEGPSMKALLKAASGEHAERLHLLDRLPHEQLFPIIEQAEFIVLPSLADNLPNTLLEALSAKKRVVATTGSCFEDFMEMPPAGLLCEPGDTESLKQGIQAMINMDSSERALMEDNAAEQVSRVNPDLILPQVERFFEHALTRENQ